MRWCLRICDDSPTGAAGCGTDLMVDSRGAGTDENRGAKPHLTSCSFRPFRFTRKRYAASVRRQNRQKLRSCCALAERCGKKHRYLLDSQNRTPG